MNSNIFENADIVSDFALKFSDFEDRHKYATIMTLMLLISDCTIPYTSAEIPPAGAPSGFDGTPQAFALK